MLHAYTRPDRGLQLLGFDEGRRVFALRVKPLVSILGGGDVDLLRRGRGCRRCCGDNGCKQKAGNSENPHRPDLPAAATIACQ
jgi:hypothetical protein